MQALFVIGLALLIVAAAVFCGFLLGHGVGYDKARARYRLKLDHSSDAHFRETSARLRESAESVASSPGSAHEGTRKARKLDDLEPPLQTRGGLHGTNYSKGFEGADPELRPDAGFPVRTENDLAQGNPLVTDPNDRP